MLAKKAPESDDAFWARKIVQSLGEKFIRQRFMDKAMECYQTLTEYRPDPEDCPEVSRNDMFEGQGPNSIEVKTQVSADVHELLDTILASECSSSRNQDDLLREAVYLLILKHATQKDVREKLVNTLAKAIKKD